MEINREVVEARVREVNDAVKLLEEILSKDFEELTVHEKLSMRYLVIQLVEATSSICIQLLNLFNESIEGSLNVLLGLERRGLYLRV